MSGFGKSTIKSNPVTDQLRSGETRRWYAIRAEGLTRYLLREPGAVLRWEVAAPKPNRQEAGILSVIRKP